MFGEETNHIFKKPIYAYTFKKGFKNHTCNWHNENLLLVKNLEENPSYRYLAFRNYMDIQH